LAFMRTKIIEKNGMAKLLMGEGRWMIDDG
jgi:hypothetical protein